MEETANYTAYRKFGVDSRMVAVGYSLDLKLLSIVTTF